MANYTYNIYVAATYTAYCAHLHNAHAHIHTHMYTHSMMTDQCMYFNLLLKTKNSSKTCIQTRQYVSMTTIINMMSVLR